MTGQSDTIKGLSRKDYNRLYYARHRERLLATRRNNEAYRRRKARTNRVYYVANREKIIARQLKYYAQRRVKLNTVIA